MTDILHFFFFKVSLSVCSLYPLQTVFVMAIGNWLAQRVVVEESIWLKWDKWKNLLPGVILPFVEFLFYVESWLWLLLYFTDLQDVKNVVDPMSKVKPGLVCGDTPVDLKGVHIRAKMLDMASEVNLWPSHIYVVMMFCTYEGCSKWIAYFYLETSNFKLAQKYSFHALKVLPMARNAKFQPMYPLLEGITVRWFGHSDKVPMNGRSKCLSGLVFPPSKECFQLRKQKQITWGKVWGIWGVRQNSYFFFLQKRRNYCGGMSWGIVM